jgi:hypothetical protein
VKLAIHTLRVSKLLRAYFSLVRFFMEPRLFKHTNMSALALNRCVRAKRQAETVKYFNQKIRGS